MTNIIPLSLEKNGKWTERGIRSIVLHHTAGKVSKTQTESIKIIRAINEEHKRRDWGGGAKAPSITYHFAMDLLGNIWLLNHPKYKTWHAGVANDVSIGVVVLGNFQEHIPSDEETEIIKKSLNEIQRWIFWRYFIPRRNWIAHRDVKKTECCGDYLYFILQDWKNRK